MCVSIYVCMVVRCGGPVGAQPYVCWRYLRLWLYYEDGTIIVVMFRGTCSTRYLLGVWGFGVGRHSWLPEWASMWEWGLGTLPGLTQRSRDQDELRQGAAAKLISYPSGVCQDVSCQKPRRTRNTSNNLRINMTQVNRLSYMAVSKNEGPHFGSPCNKDHQIFGSILGPPVYGSPHIWRGTFFCQLTAGAGGTSVDLRKAVAARLPLPP